jgi:tetratricopeptide (TPR) repeat protein
MEKYTIIYLFLLLSCNLFGQIVPQDFSLSDFKVKKSGYIEALENYKKGDEYQFSKHPNFDEAIKYYEKAYNYNPDFYPLTQTLANLYWNSSHFMQSFKYLSKMGKLNDTIDNSVDIKIGKIFQCYYNYDSALFYFKRAFKNAKNAKDGISIHRYINECLNAPKFLLDTLAFSVSNLGVPLNSPASEYAPVFSIISNRLYFSSGSWLENSYRPLERTYYSQFANFKWTNPTEFNPNNVVDGFYIFSLTYFSENQDYILFIGLKNTSSTSPLKLYSMSLNNQTWSLPKEVLNLNSKYSFLNSTINKTFDTIYFTQKQTITGTTDIYVSVKDIDGKWSSSVPMSSKINTEYNERVFYLSPDGKEIVFGSDGHEGLGGMDLYKTIKDRKGEWSEPINLGYPINTPFDDFGYSKNGDTVFISSNREPTFGYNDILMIYKKNTH